VPSRKLFGPPGTGNGAGGTTYGLPRFNRAAFATRFPFATVKLSDEHLPLETEILGWSPFAPGDPDNSSLPVAALEYRFTNRGRSALDTVFSFNAKNFMAMEHNPKAVRPIAGGFILWGGAPKDKPWEEGAFSATVSEPGVKVNHAWFRGGWWDALTMAWKEVSEGSCEDRPPITQGGASPGATLAVPFALGPGESKTIVLRLAWYSGQTNLRIGKDPVKVYPYRTCNSVGCLAETPFDDALATALNGADDASVMFAGLDGKPVSVPMSFKGYKASLAAWKTADKKRSAWFWRLWS